MDTATTLDKGHGRIERRALKATTALNDYLDWPGVGQVGQVESEVVKDGKTSHEIRYFITSVSRPVAGAGQLLKWARGHWSVENRSHYVRDVTMGEDASRIRKRSGPEVMAAFRNATIGLLRTMGVTNIAEALRRNASQVGGLFARLGILKGCNYWVVVTQLSVFCRRAVGLPASRGRARRRSIRRSGRWLVGPASPARPTAASASPSAPCDP